MQSTDPVTPDTATAVARAVLEKLGDAGPLELQRATIESSGGRQVMRTILRHSRRQSLVSCWFLVIGPGAGGRLVAGGAVGHPTDQPPVARPGERRLAPEALDESLVSATECTHAAGIAVPFDLAVALALVAGVLTGSRRLPRLQVRADAGPTTLQVSPLDDCSVLAAVRERLLEQFERHLASSNRTDGPAWRSGDLVAGAMLEFKGRYGDGLLANWTTADLREFLLTWFPGIIVTDDATVADVSGSASAFLRFLDDRGDLRGDPLPALESVCDTVGAELPGRYAATPRRGAAAAVADALRGPVG